MKRLTSVLVVGFLALALAACGSGESSTGEGSSTVGAAESAEVEALRLEKEKAEFEAQKAQAEARSKVREAKKQAAQASQQEATQSVAAEKAPEPESGEVPDVVGLRLPQAEAALSAAGYRTEAENTDTVLGIVVPSHYTVCEQAEPQGSVVTVLAQKYGC